MIDSWEREGGVLQQMNRLNQPHIVRFLTAFRRGSPGDEEHYLMLEWADGGNLRDFWNTMNRPALTPELVKDSIRQILGLANAICKAHYPETGPNFRHGDLKPENILWFKDESGRGIGTLKIGDWGLAKQHVIVTELRSNKTSMEWSTRRYEPPEEMTGHGVALKEIDQRENTLAVPDQRENMPKKRSRLYDIWAMGCITLEFLIWLMYGPRELERFNRSLGSDSYSRFYQVRRKRGQLEAELHDTVTKWIEHMGQDPICQPGTTALGNLLEVIQTRLLVVKLPDRLATSTDLSSQSTQPRRHSLYVGNFDNVDNSDDAAVSPAAKSTPLATPSDPTKTPSIVVEEPKSQRSHQAPALRDAGTDIERFVIARSPPGWERARASAFRDQMQIISGEDETESYWFTDHVNARHGPATTNSGALKKADAGELVTIQTLEATLPVPRTELVRSPQESNACIELANEHFQSQVVCTLRAT